MSVKRDSIQADRQVLSVDARDQERKRERGRGRERGREGGRERERERKKEERGRGMSIYVPNDASWGVREHTWPKGCIMEGCTAHVMVLEPRSAA